MLCASAVVARAEADYGAIARAALTDYIRPAYGHLAKRSGALAETMDALCASPGSAALKDVKEAFAGAVETWGIVEPLRFGPIAQEHRYERLFYWPDPKGLGAKQIREALAQRDASVTDQAALAAKSVALQGFPALELLLYGDGADALENTGEEGAFRCRFAASVAANIKAIAHEVDQGWGEGTPFTRDFLSPGPDDPFYRAPKEVTLELLKAFSGGIEIVRDLKPPNPWAPSPRRRSRNPPPSP